MRTGPHDLSHLEGATCRECDPPVKLEFGALHNHLAEQHPARYRALSPVRRGPVDSDEPERS